MKTWQKYRVKDLCTDIVDCVNKTAPISDVPTPFHMLRTSDVRDGFINLENLNCVSEETFHKWSRRGYLKEGDIVFTREAPLGEAGLVRTAENYFLGQRLVLYRTNPAVCDNHFLLYWFLNPQNKENIKSRGVGATVTHLRVPECEQFEVHAPDVETQKRIGSVLFAYDSLIENNQKQIKLLEEAAQRLYKEWFIDLRFPGHESTPIHDGIPEGWRNVQLNEIDLRLESGARPKGGIDNSIQNGVPSIGAENVIGLGQYNYSSEKLIPTDFYDSMKKGKLVDRDILIYKDGAYIGRTSLFQDGFPHSTAAINEHVFLLHANDESLQYYLFFTLYQAEYYKKMQKLNKNAAQPGINTKAILSLDVLLPPISVIKRFDEIVAPIIRVLFSKAKQNHNLTEARDRLLPKLMSGEIEV